MKKLLYTISIMAAFACDEVITLELNQAEEKVVIEALLTNTRSKQYVKLSKTLGFYAKGRNPVISGAAVSVSDDEGETVSYSESDETPGLYLPPPDFAGVVGRSYTLKVTVDGKKYSATEKLLPVTEIKKLSAEVDEEASDDEWRFYNLLMFITEPQNEKNFYMFKTYINGIWMDQHQEDIMITDDELIRQSIDGAEMGGFSTKNPRDSASLEIYSLSQRQYVYWSDLANLIESDGGVFAPLPANPRSNIEGGALGVFQVSAIASEYVIVEK